RNQNARACVARLIEHEAGVLLAVCAEAPVVEKELAKAGALDSLQKLFRDDLVGVDVDAVQRSHAAAMYSERFHFVIPFPPSGFLGCGPILSKPLCKPFQIVLQDVANVISHATPLHPRT